MNGEKKMSTLLQSVIAETLTNYSQTNRNTPSHHVRKEGWSEVWGGSSVTKSTKNPNQEKELLLKSHQLLQYRIGWSAQLLLRQCNIPHLVENTPYISNQTTGSYPQYRNLNERVMVGNEDILPYLVVKYKVDDHLSLSQKSDMLSLKSLIQDLDEMQKILWYGDADAWNEIYRKQCIKASTLHQMEHLSEDRVKHINGFAWFQAWAERAIHLKYLKFGFHSRFYVEGNNTFHVDKVVQFCNDVYQALDHRLAESQSNSLTTLLSSEMLSSVDMLLFEHLANAMCDVHLVTVLDGKNHLIRYFQDIYHRYFRDYKSSTIINLDPSIDWVKMNNRTNALNQFNHVPLDDLIHTNSVHKGNLQDVITIMQQIAVHCHDLQEILADMSIQKKRDDSLYASETGLSKAGSMFRKVCLLGELSTETNDEDTDEEDGDDIMKKNRRQMKKMMKDAKKNDEIWVSGVLIAAVIGLLSVTNG
jgi:hypothetical protein